MFLRAKTRFKDGKEHRYWSIVESRRSAGGRVVQRHVLYLGEINDSQKAAWCKTIEVFDEGGERPTQRALFPEDREAPPLDCEVVQVKLNPLQLRRPRHWGACWLACHLWEPLRLDDFWAEKLPPSRQGTRWLNVFKTWVCYRLIDPGSEWRLHRHWYEQSALADFIQKIETQYGKAQRIWVMDRGIPTEETLTPMRAAETPMYYLVGTPKGRLSKLEKDFLKLPWEAVREAVEVKLLDQEGKLYVLARSSGRADKERSMRRRRLKKLLKRLQELQQQDLTRDQLLLKRGAAKKEAGRAYGLVNLRLPDQDQAVTPETFRFTLNRKKLRIARRREGSDLLRSNLTGDNPALLWQYYIQLTEVEQAFKELKGDLSIRPIYHPLDARIEAHIFVAFMAYCLQVTLKHRLRALAPGLTPRSVLEKMAALQRVDVHLPTTDGRCLILSRYTQHETDQQLLLSQLKLQLPAQLPPKITANATATL
ncbi:MAG: IS1634 family transposase [Gammaproteobacteria bacterium]